MKGRKKRKGTSLNNSPSLRDGKKNSSSHRCDFEVSSVRFISLRDRDRVSRPRRRSQGFVTRSCPTKERMTNLWEATIEFDCWITTDSFRVLHEVDSVNVKQELGFKSKAILYHVDISGRLIGKGVVTSLDGNNGRSIQTLLRE